MGVKVINFNEVNEVKKWRITNDSVMGGESTSQIVHQQNYGLFKGTISLENNGGFSSVFRAVEQLTKVINVVMIDIEGDGHTYQLRMVVNIEGYRLNYKCDFKTVAGTRKRLKFNLADFQAIFRGRAIINVPKLASEAICEIGFLINPKIAENFALKIYQISFHKNEAESFYE